MTVSLSDVSRLFIAAKESKSTLPLTVNGSDERKMVRFARFKSQVLSLDWIGGGLAALSRGISSRRLQLLALLSFKPKRNGPGRQATLSSRKRDGGQQGPICLSPQGTSLAQ